MKIRLFTGFLLLVLISPEVYAEWGVVAEGTSKEFKNLIFTSSLFKESLSDAEKEALTDCREIADDCKVKDVVRPESCLYATQQEAQGNTYNSWHKRNTIRDAISSLNNCLPNVPDSTACEITFVYCMYVAPIKDRIVVKRAQKILNNLGFQAGQADGVTGQRTGKAIQDFQRANDKPVTGELTTQTYSELTDALTAKFPSPIERHAVFNSPPKKKPTPKAAASPVTIGGKYGFVRYDSISVGTEFLECGRVTGWEGDDTFDWDSTCGPTYIISCGVFDQSGIYSCSYARLSSAFASLEYGGQRDSDSTIATANYTHGYPQYISACRKGDAECGAYIKKVRSVVKNTGKFPQEYVISQATMLAQAKTQVEDQGPSNLRCDTKILCDGGGRQQVTLYDGCEYSNKKGYSQFLCESGTTHGRISFDGLRNQLGIGSVECNGRAKFYESGKLKSCTGYGLHINQKKKDGGLENCDPGETMHFDEEGYLTRC